ncbi:dhal domain-containing protein [Cryomyces antarcticus]
MSTGFTLSVLFSDMSESGMPKEIRKADLVPLRTPKGQVVLLDEALSKNKYACIAAVGTPGNFSSKLLSDKHIAAIVTEKTGAGILTAQDIAYAINSSGHPIESLIVVRCANRRHSQVHDMHVVEVELNGELEFNHVLTLLGTAEWSTRVSIHQLTEVLGLFVRSATSTTTTFHTEKTEANPAVFHSDGRGAFETAEGAIEKDLTQVMRSHTSYEDSVVYSVHYSDINGLSKLENYILAHEISVFLDAHNVPYHTSSSTLLNHAEGARGWTISICPIPLHHLSPQPKPPNTLAELHISSASSMNSRDTVPSFLFSDSKVRRYITSGCESVIDAEPTITEYDTIVGDGDCGYTLRDGAKQVLKYIAGKDLAQLSETLGSLVDELEVNMGGTSGALYCIFLAALAHSLWDAPSFPDALVSARDHLLKYTRARLGDRTCLDCLIPFVDTLRETHDARKALQKAREGVEGTKTLEAKLGRSTYLDESATRGVPDPGAYGLLVLLEGMCKAWA